MHNLWLNNYYLRLCLVKVNFHTRKIIIFASLLIITPQVLAEPGGYMSCKVGNGYLNYVVCEAVWLFVVAIFTGVFFIFPLCLVIVHYLFHNVDRSRKSQVLMAILIAIVANLSLLVLLPSFLYFLHDYINYRNEIAITYIFVGTYYLCIMLLSYFYTKSMPET